MIKVKNASGLILFITVLICTSASFADSDNWYHFNEGLENIKAKNYNHAERNFNYYLRHPEWHRRMFGVAYFGRGLLSQAKGMPEAAIVEYKKAIQNDIHPNVKISGKAFRNIGTITMKNKKYDEAISAYLNAVKFDKMNGFSHYYLGLAYFENENYKEAAREADEAKRLGVTFSALRDKLNKLKKSTSTKMEK